MLSPARFNAFLGGAVRQNFLWRQHSACPCVNPGSGSANPTCTVCGGTGHTWAAPVEAWAGMTNQTPQKAQAVFGSWSPGDSNLTIPSDSPMYAAARFDRFQALASTSPFSEVRTPGVNARLLGAVLSLTKVFWLNDAQTAFVDGTLPVVASDGTLSWPDGGGPPAGVSFTVEGVRYLEFYVWGQLPGSRNSGVSGLPLKLAARSFDMLGRMS